MWEEDGITEYMHDIETVTSYEEYLDDLDVIGQNTDE